MSEVCAEFSQNAWRKDLCANCLRPRSEHINPPCNHLKPRRNSAGRGSPPVPAKRNSSLIKSNLSSAARVSSVVDKNANDHHNVNEDIKLLSIRPLVVEDNVSGGIATHSSDENPLSCEEFGSKHNSTKIKVDPHHHHLSTLSQNSLKSVLKLSGNKDENRAFRVVFSDCEPEVIGHDGGYDYLYQDDDDDVPEETEITPPGSIQLTEEEKQFALLALENTLWNSDIHNLRVETPLEGRLKRVPSKEFEDIELEFLWKADRFQGLRDCDLLPKKFGTFPRRNKSPKAQLSSRPSLEFSHVDNKISPLKSSKNLDNASIQDADEDSSFRLRSASENSTLYQSRSMLNSASKNNMNPNTSKDTDHIERVGSSPYRVIDSLPKPAPKPASLKKGVSDPVEKPVASVRHKDERQLSQAVMSMMSRSVEGRLEDCFEKPDIEGDSDTLRRHGLKPPAPVKRQHLTKEGTIGRRDEMSSSFAGTTFDRKYDRDDFLILRVEGDPYEARNSKAKSVDFEAKMASVAATLDFTKTKGKRQAPQPPVSPGAGVTASPSKSSSKSSDVVCKKGPSLEQCRRSAVGDDVDPMESLDKGKKNENTMKKGFASMFRSFLRRGGRDSSSESSTEQSFDNNTSVKPNDMSKEVPSIIYDSKSDFLSPDNGNIDDSMIGQYRVRVFPSPTKSTVSVSSTTSSTSNENLDSRPLSDMIISSDVRIESQDRTRELDDELDVSNPSSRKSTLSRESIHQPNIMSNSSNICETTEDVVVVKRRVKSPKRVPAPTAPRCTAACEKNALFAKELELRLSKAVDNKTGTLKKAPAPQPPAPPPPLIEDDANNTDTPVSSATPPPMAEGSRPEAATDVRPVERIELPKAPQSRRSFLGKFAGNRRSRPPPPPVKRAKSITEASLPLHDLHMKKIDLSDISGPVLLAETSSSGTVSRRNTVTLGDDSAFGSGGSASSGSGGDKNFDDPNISPLGSVENLYEPITPKYPGQRDNYYYPVDPSRSNSASRTSSNGSSNFPTEGYLEPITSMRPPSVVTTAPVVTTAVVSVGTTPTASVIAAASFSAVPTDSGKLQTIHMEPVRTSFTESSAESSPQLSAELPPNQNQEPLHSEIPDEEERQIILASQPIYEEINGYSKNNADDEPPPLPKDNRIPRSTIGEAKTPIQSRSSEDLLENSSPTPQPLLAPLPQPTMGTLTRPKPAPRRKPKRPHGAPPEQYVAMNRPATVTISLGADDVKEMYGKLTSMNQDTLQHIHNYFENIFSRGLDRTLGFLKWSDFELISKQPVHTAEDCIVYSAKLLQDKASYHLVLTHGNNVCDSYVPHPAFMRLQNLSANDIPASFLPSMSATTDHNSTFPIGSSSSSIAVIPSPHWHLAVGPYSSMATWHDYIADLKDTMLHNPDSFVQILSFLFLQVVSGILHHLDRGSPQLHFRPVRIFLLSQKNFSGKRVCLLPSYKADNKLPSNMNDFCAKLLHNLFDKYLFEDEKLLECSKGLYRGLELLQSDKPDCLAIVRGMLELVIWGPYPSELAGSTFTSQEQAYDFWLDKERAMMVNRFARCSLDPSGSFSIEDFYKLRFLLNSTGTTLVENSQYIS